jgi:hypothetical protein
LRRTEAGQTMMIGRDTSYSREGRCPDGQENLGDMYKNVKENTIEYSMVFLVDALTTISFCGK